MYDVVILSLQKKSTVAISSADEFLVVLSGTVDLSSSMCSVAGVWGVGVATRTCDVQNVPLGCDSDSWVLRHDGSLCHNNAEVCRLAQLPEEGDIIVSVPSTVFVMVNC